MIAWLALAFSSVFYCFLWAIANTRHTVGAFVPPHRLAVNKFDIVERTKFDALAATYAIIGCIKSL